MSERTRADIEELGADECLALLASTDVGRIAVVAGDSVDIFPVNFLVKDGSIYFSSGPGSKMILLTAHPRVAFEADGIAGYRRWSVVAKGEAHRLDTDSEIEESGVLTLLSRTPTQTWNYVRIAPEDLTGRRFASAHAAPQSRGE